MKNLLWQSSAICSSLLGIGTVWVWARYGWDPLMPVLFLISIATTFLVKSKHDGRLASLRKTVSEAVIGRTANRIGHIGAMDEIGELCRDINKMLDRFESMVAEKNKTDEKIRILQKTVSEFAAGRTENRLSSIDETGEIGELSRDINEMLDRLESPDAENNRSDGRIRILQNIANEVAAGKLTGRITNIGKKDEVGQLCWNINNMLDQIEACFREQETVLRMASQHKFFRNAQTAGLHGVYASSLVATNQSKGTMEQNKKIEEETLRIHRLAQEEIAELIAYAADGDFEKRLETHGKEGFFLDLANNLNRLMGTIQNGLESVAQILKAISEGDLTKKIDQDFHGLFGSIKEDTNTTVEKLKDIVGQIKAASEAVETAAKEIASGNQDLAGRTSQQAGSLEQTSSSMEEISSAVRQNSENAVRAKELTGNANDVVKTGWEMMRNIASTMSDIQASSRKIEDIVGIIDSIAFQTNILALNAAVEAARAGEQGRGFAVVATEVRSLSQRSANAAKEIKALIEESVDKVEGGAGLVQQAENTMEEVVNLFKNVATLITEISVASREQSSGIELVAQAITSIDDATQQNAALVEEATAAAESLEEQAEILVQSVGTFKLSDSLLIRQY